VLRAGLSAAAARPELILAALPDPARIRAILLDIEGTTTPIAFVYEVLFPFASAHLEQFLHQNCDRRGVRDDLKALAAEHAAEPREAAGLPPWHDDSSNELVVSAIAYARWLMDRDRKSTVLKSLQGKIWEAGYRSGELRGQVFPDVARAFARWRQQKRGIAIFSSGSVLAQRLLFGHSTAGDLTPFISTYFDTTSGPKLSRESYRRIATALECAPAEIVFLSDVVAELDAARGAAMETLLCVRPGSAEPGSPAEAIIHTFDELFP
jgi:enolase-phosphatase E1